MLFEICAHKDLSKKISHNVKLDLDFQFANLSVNYTNFVKCQSLACRRHHP